MGEVPGRVLEQAGQAGLGKLHVLGDARRVVVEPSVGVSGIVVHLVFWNAPGVRKPA